jgi:glucosamine kinase
VERLAAAGDRAANTILERNAAALATSVRGVAQALALTSPPVAAMGGALTHLAILRRQVERALAQQLPGARLQAAHGDACAGALALAAERLCPTLN